jgi:hypothetical protein
MQLIGIFQYKNIYSVGIFKYKIFTCPWLPAAINLRLRSFDNGMPVVDARKSTSDANVSKEFFSSAEARLYARRAPASTTRAPIPTRMEPTYAGWNITDRI